MYIIKVHSKILNVLSQLSVKVVKIVLIFANSFKQVYIEV